MRPKLISTLSMCLLAAIAHGSQSPEARLGERLFLETRFAEFFHAAANGDANATLAQGDPVMDTTATGGQPFPGPYAGKSMNCAACHLESEHLNTPGGGMRPLCDFAPTSPLPSREDGRKRNVRNTPVLVDALGGGRKGVLLHYDGEFARLEDLIVGTLAGRNFGWTPAEYHTALAHVARIIRDDNGTGELAQASGGLPYAVVFKGTDPGIPAEHLLPKQSRIDVSRASDTAVLRAVAKMIRAYLEEQQFTRDSEGAFTGSPYDAFLRNNNLPTKPDRGETDLAYMRRLRQLVEQLDTPRFVTNSPAVFGEEELHGLKVFLREPSRIPMTDDELGAGETGNCAICHTPPYFTDFKFHNIGVSQHSYDVVHGEGSFAALPVPDLAARLANPDAFLPATRQRPNALGPFRSAASTNAPGHVDLGLWNVFANPDFPRPQRELRKILTESGRASPAELLPQTIGLFKTPGLRNLNQSWPYFHNGSQDSLAAVLYFYMEFAERAREGTARNIDPQMPGMDFTKTRLELLLFLRSLNAEQP